MRRRVVDFRTRSTYLHVQATHSLATAVQVERLALQRLRGGGDHAARDGHGHEAPFVVLVRHDGEARVAELADDALEKKSTDGLERRLVIVELESWRVMRPMEVSSWPGDWSLVFNNGSRNGFFSEWG